MIQFNPNKDRYANPTGMELAFLRHLLVIVSISSFQYFRKWLKYSHAHLKNQYQSYIDNYFYSLHGESIVKNQNFNLFHLFGFINHTNILRFSKDISYDYNEGRYICYLKYKKTNYFIVFFTRAFRLLSEDLKASKYIILEKRNESFSIYLKPIYIKNHSNILLNHPLYTCLQFHTPIKSMDLEYFKVYYRSKQIIDINLLVNRCHYLKTWEEWESVLDLEYIKYFRNIKLEYNWFRRRYLILCLNKSIKYHRLHDLTKDLLIYIFSYI